MVMLLLQPGCQSPKMVPLIPFAMRTQSILEYVSPVLVNIHLALML